MLTLETEALDYLQEGRMVLIQNINEAFKTTVAMRIAERLREKGYIIGISSNDYLWGKNNGGSSYMAAMDILKRAFGMSGNPRIKDVAKWFQMVPGKKVLVVDAVRPVVRDMGVPQLIVSRVAPAGRVKGYVMTTPTPTDSEKEEMAKESGYSLRVFEALGKSLKLTHIAYMNAKMKGKIQPDLEDMAKAVYIKLRESVGSTKRNGIREMAHMIIVLKVLAEYEGLTKGELVKKYEEECKRLNITPNTPRSVSNYTYALNGIIAREPVYGGAWGNTTYFRLLIDPEIVYRLVIL